MLNSWLDLTDSESDTTTILPTTTDNHSHRQTTSVSAILNVLALGIVSAITSVISFFARLCDITKRSFSILSFKMQRQGRHVVPALVKGGPTTPAARSPLHELRNIYPLGPSPTTQSDSSIPLPRHFFRKTGNPSSWRTQSTTKTKTPAMKRGSTGGATFLRKVLSIDFKKKTEAPAQGEIRNRKRSIVAPATSPSIGSFTNIESDSGYGPSVRMSRMSSESSTRSVESGVESDSTLYVSEDEQPLGLKRKQSIQEEITTDVRTLFFIYPNQINDP